MQSKDVILQVSDETAEVMEEISEQLFNETDARFDVIDKAIAESVKKIEKLHADFTGYSEASDKRFNDNQVEVVSKLKELQDDLAGFKNKSEEAHTRVEEKSTQLITITSELPALIKIISEEVDTVYQYSKDSDKVIIDDMRVISENILKVQEELTAITKKINEDDIGEKLNILFEKISETKNNIQTETIAIGRISETLARCSFVLERIASDMNNYQNDMDKILVAEEVNADSVRKLAEQNGENSTELIAKLSEVLDFLGKLSTSVQSTAEQQAEFSTKQSRLEEDIKYLKLPFYKRWFMKG